MHSIFIRRYDVSLVIMIKNNGLLADVSLVVACGCDINQRVGPTQ